ncbi:pseudouridine synthase [Alkalicoccobacillus murimartini]|uniref:Pseudouridine synthase n=1 Tax=Alkalicoccobacillus murimartini TaxID=171685 RepID=A0ABT9YJZ8_9BACI|nr:pseudouridine synthase [Alkalicoccobacillus murimartini]MDQ0208180.1 16S rRNA pseudouridine516 synthase [Alkalicoccobacillus murimartini]
MRLDKFLADSGYGSRKEVKKLLKSGLVSVDDGVVKEAKSQIDVEKQKVTVSGDVIEYQAEVYLMLNKPQGVISATEDTMHKTVIDLLHSDWERFKLFPVGRLDKDTEGLLLLTTDGAFSHQLMSPRRHVSKVYEADVDGEVTKEDVDAFSVGVRLDDGYMTKPAELVIKEAGTTSKIELTITEGKFHQVKRMFKARGKTVLTLKRRAIGKLELDPSLAPGSYRQLTEEEYKLFQ